MQHQRRTITVRKVQKVIVTRLVIEYGLAQEMWMISIRGHLPMQKDVFDKGYSIKDSGKAYVATVNPPHPIHISLSTETAWFWLDNVNKIQTEHLYVCDCRAVKDSDKTRKWLKKEWFRSLTSGASISRTSGTFTNPSLGYRDRLINRGVDLASLCAVDFDVTNRLTTEELSTIDELILSTSNRDLRSIMATQQTFDVHFNPRQQNTVEVEEVGINFDVSTDCYRVAFRWRNSIGGERMVMNFEVSNEMMYQMGQERVVRDTTALVIPMLCDLVSSPETRYVPSLRLVATI